MSYLIFALLVLIGLLITIVVTQRKHYTYEIKQLNKEIDKKHPKKKQQAQTEPQKPEPQKSELQKTEHPHQPKMKFSDSAFPKPMDTQSKYPSPHMPVPYSQTQWITSIPEEQKMQHIMGISEEALRVNFLSFLCLENDCRAFDINVFPVNICNLQILLAPKGIHLEFIKYGLENYNPQPETYFGSPLWQKRWKKIVISSTMSPDELFQCIRYMMNVHYLRDEISITDESSLRNAIQKMNYKIRIRKNDAVYENLKIKMAADLTDEARKDEVWKSLNQEEHFTNVKLGKVTDIRDGVSANNIETNLLRPYNGQGYGILFRKDLSIGRPEYSLYNHPRVPTNTVIMTAEAPFMAVGWKSLPVTLSEELIGLIVSDPEHLCVEYLTLFICLQVKEMDKELTSGKPLSCEAVSKMDIALPSLDHQKGLFDYCMSIPREQVLEYIRTNFPSIAHTMDKNREIIRSCYT